MHSHGLKISLVILAASFFTFFSVQQLPAAAIVDGMFEEMIEKNQLFMGLGAKLVRENLESVLRLADRSNARLSLSRNLSARSGTVMFWVRPLWKQDDHQSHVFLTGQWGDGKKGYLAVSYGWWEPLGTGRIYFVVNNEEIMHCSERYRFEPAVWTRLAVSWKSGPQGNCRIFINGSKIAEYVAPFPGDYALSGPIFLGSDRGATDQSNRLSNFEIDDFRIYDYEMSEHFIIDLDQKKYHQRMGKPLTGGEWMEPDIHDGVAVSRDPEGMLRETRALFDEDIHWAYSMEAADRTLERVRAAGFNVYIPCVWHGRGAHYPTDFSLPDDRLAGLLKTGYDPLGYLIAKAHQIGIEVHPWFTVVRRDWNRYPEFFPSGSPENAYDVHHPGFREFMIRLMLDAVRRYDLDGINLDYIRTMGVCTSSGCRQEYEIETGHDLLSDLESSSAGGKARDRIQLWQERAVSEIVRGFSQEARKIKPGLIISVDGNPKPRNALRSLEGRDELRWMENGWVDVTFNMDYRPRIDYETIDQVRTELADPARLYLLYGNFDYLDGKPVSRSGKMIERYVKFSRVKWPESGIGLYLFNMLNDRQMMVLRKSVFAEFARPLWPGVKPLRKFSCDSGKACGRDASETVSKGP